MKGSTGFVNLIKKLFFFPLDENQLEWLRENKPTIDQAIGVIDSKIKKNIGAENFYLEPDKYFCSQRLDKQLEIILKKIEIPNTDFRMVKDCSAGAAGQFRVFPGATLDLNTNKIEWTVSNPTLTIGVSEKFLKEPILASAVLVHEITHLYVHRHNLNKFFDISQFTRILGEESMCEITTFLLGFGKIYLNGAFDAISKEEKTISLSPSFPWYGFFYIYERINFLKGISEKVSRKNLDAFARGRLARVSNYRDLIE